MPETTPIEEITTPEPVNDMIIEIIEPEKKFVDEVGEKIPGEFEKIFESTVLEDGAFITTRRIEPMSDDEILSSKIKSLKIKVALGTATTSEKSDLKLLIF